MEQPTTNYLEDLELTANLIPASKGARFVNFIIDYIIFYVLVYGISFLYAIIAISQGDDLSDSYLVSESGTAQLFLFMVYLLSFIAYYTIIEALTKGRSLGKLITGTVAIREDGNKIGWNDAILRSLCRLIPFEPLASLFTTPWHDSITKTMVVKK